MSTGVSDCALHGSFLIAQKRPFEIETNRETIRIIRQAQAKVRKCYLRFLPRTHNYFTTIIQFSLHLNHKGIIIVSDSDREKETQKDWACDVTTSCSKAHGALLQACVFMLCYGSRVAPHTAHGQKLLVL